MRISKKVAGAASLIAIAAAVACVQASNADNLASFSQNTLADHCADTTNGAFAHDPSDYRFANRSDDRFDNRFDNRFENRFKNGFDNRFDGRLDDRFTNQIGSNYGDTFDYRFGNRFDNRFDARMGQHFNFALNQMRDNISRLEAKVETGRQQHRLSINEYNLFKDRLAQQERKCDQLAFSNGRFDQRQLDKMSDTLSKLDSLIATSLNSGPFPTAYGNRFGGFYRGWN